MSKPKTIIMKKTEDMSNTKKNREEKNKKTESVSKKKKKLSDQDKINFNEFTDDDIFF